MNKEQLLAKLDKPPFANSEITKLANAGDFAAAAEQAARGAVWGIWGYCREVAGLPFDDDARNQWLADFAAKRKARFEKR